MPSVSNLQGRGAGTGTARGRLGTRTSGKEITVGSKGPGRGDYLGAWLSSGCGRYRGKL